MRDKRQGVYTADYLSFLRGSNLSQSEESRAELVTDEAAGVWIGISSVACFARWSQTVQAEVEGHTIKML